MGTPGSEAPVILEKFTLFWKMLSIALLCERLTAQTKKANCEDKERNNPREYFAHARKSS
jgi:hypothetical protein